MRAMPCSRSLSWCATGILMGVGEALKHHSFVEWSHCPGENWQRRRLRCGGPLGMRGEYRRWVGVTFLTVPRVQEIPPRAGSLRIRLTSDPWSSVLNLAKAQTDPTCVRSQSDLSGAGSRQKVGGGSEWLGGYPTGERSRFGGDSSSGGTVESGEGLLRRCPSLSVGASPRSS